jgi:uncharacterized membrane protein
VVIDFTAVALCYILMGLALYKFNIEPRKPIWEAFLLGLVIYGIYDTTNKATFIDWDWNTAIMDTLWGASLFAIVSYIYQNYII